MIECAPPLVHLYKLCFFDFSSPIKNLFGSNSTCK
jgi:hypothetical protein